MKTMIGLMILCLALPAAAQETQQHAWEFSPALTFTKYFPGDPIPSQSEWSGPIPWASYIYAPSGASEFRYAGTGLRFNVRAFNDEMPNLALTFGAGVTWYYDAEGTSGIAIPSSVSGIGQQVHREDFTAFPVALGLQVVYPYAGRDNFMMFAGIEGNLNLISGNVPMADQAKLGIGLTGGFAVKIFEFSVRYISFSDIRNLGASIGFRLNPFTL
jgi:hypothetical protein